LPPLRVEGTNRSPFIRRAKEKKKEPSWDGKKGAPPPGHFEREDDRASAFERLIESKLRRVPLLREKEERGCAGATSTTGPIWRQRFHGWKTGKRCPANEMRGPKKGKSAKKAGNPVKRSRGDIVDPRKGKDIKRIAASNYRQVAWPDCEQKNLGIQRTPDHDEMKEKDWWERKGKILEGTMPKAE